MTQFCRFRDLALLLKYISSTIGVFLLKIEALDTKWLLKFKWQLRKYLSMNAYDICWFLHPKFNWYNPEYENLNLTYETNLIICIWTSVKQTCRILEKRKISEEKRTNVVEVHVEPSASVSILFKIFKSTTIKRNIYYIFLKIILCAFIVIL